MFANHFSSVGSALKSRRRASARKLRDATARRGLYHPEDNAFAVARARTHPANASASADRIGAAVTLLLSVGLLAGGWLAVAQLWSNLAMVR